MKALVNHLTQLSWWKKHGGKDFLILNSFYWVKDAIGVELMDTLLKGPAIFTSSDKNYIDFQDINSTTIPTIVPYKAHYRLEDAAWLALEGPPKERTSTLMFHGSTSRGTKRGYSEGELRQNICDLLGPAFEDTDMRCSELWLAHESFMKAHVSSLDHRAPLDTEPFNATSAQYGRVNLDGGQKEVVSDDKVHRWIVPDGRLTDLETLTGYTNSKLCLIPAGDTPTSRRLFDAMAAGCVPLLLTPYEDIKPNLPFPTVIDWPRTALFGGGLSCSLKDNLNGTIRWIQRLLGPKNKQKLECMGRRAQRTFALYLSLRDEGVVTGLLNELQQDRRYRWFLASPSEALEAASQEVFGTYSAHGLQMATRQEQAVSPLASRSTKDASPSAASSCDTKDQCGCLGTAMTTFYIRYHKTGCVLTRQIMDEIEGQCGIISHSVQATRSGDTPAEILAADDLAGSRCNSLKVAIDGNNLFKYSDEVLKNLTQPREGVRFVHMLREPLQLVASYYAYHTTGAIGGESNLTYWKSYQQNLTQLSLADGLAVVAKLVMEEQLPAMVKVHDHLVQSGRGTTTSSGSLTHYGADVLEMRMEDFEANFDETIASLLSHSGISADCAAEGQPLRTALAKHDVSRFSSEQIARNRHISRGDGSGPTLEDEALHELLTGDEALRSSLKDFGMRLGYSYPKDEPNDTFPEAESRQDVDEAVHTALVMDAALAALGNDEGLSHQDEPFAAFTSLLQGSQRLRPRIVHTTACSESSALMRYAGEVLALHGIDVDTSLPEELFKREKNPASLDFAKQGKNTSVNTAFEVMAARVARQNQTLLIKDMSPHWASSVSLKALRNLGAYSTHASRANYLDQLVCQVRDCFGPEEVRAGVAMNTSTGNESTMCFARRQLPPTDQPKALLNTSNLIHQLRDRKLDAQDAQDAQDALTELFVTEQLLEFEFSDSDDGVERSLQEWKRLMLELGVDDFKDDDVRKLFNSHRGEQQPQSLHRETIYNLNEVAATLKGTEFEYLLRL